MKPIFYTVVFSVLCVQTAMSQLTLQPGATWLFDGTVWPGMPYGEKWEYTGDSVSSAGTIKKMRVTTRYTTSPDGVIYEEVTQRHFTVTGDTVRYNGRVMANFGLQEGDQTTSPFLTSANLATYACDTSIFYYPATVVSTGMANINGQNYRSYVIRYLRTVSPSGDSAYVVKNFSEYYLLQQGYWEEPAPNGGPQCTYVADYAYWPFFTCYYDPNIRVPQNCTQVWFDQLAVNETDITSSVSLFPNPTADVLNVSIPQTGGNWNYQILSVDGKHLLNGNLPGNRVDVTALRSGMYFLLLENGSRTARIPFVKQ